jgi:hypothetical protein
MQPIDPQSFYGLPPGPPASPSLSPHWHGSEPTDPIEPPIDPSLTSTSTPTSTTTNASNASNASNAPACATNSHVTSSAKPKSTRKPRTEFSGHDLDQLLRAVITINPYMATRNKSGKQWKTVAQMVQDKGYCVGRDPDTLKNKVVALLAWVEVRCYIIPIFLTKHFLQGGKKSSGRSPLGREAENDPASFASLSGKLNVVADLKRTAKGVKDQEKDKVKAVSTLALLSNVC